jgi:UMF1 family MFS transporter
MIWRDKKILSWALYDWGNSAFATTVMAAVLPVYYANVAGAGLEEGQATTYWGYTQTISALIVACLAPFLGALADASGRKKRYMLRFAFLGMLASALLATVGEGAWLLASGVFVMGAVGFAGANIFYDSFLPDIADDDVIDSVSSYGYALGYLGGGVLLGLNLAMISAPGWFGLPDVVTATRVSFITVAVWWLLFTIPFIKNIGESKPAETLRPGESIFVVAYGRLCRTFAEIRQYRELFKFLIAFWLFNDGINTIIKMATIYGADLGIENKHLLGALLMTQFIGIPCTLVFGWLAGKIGARTGLYIALGTYVCITIFATQMTTGTHFFMLAAAVGLVQGGAQSLSRSIYGSMTPAHKRAEFFSFYGLSAKFSAILGPLLFATINEVTGSSRWGIFSIIMFFVLGLILLPLVNIDEGRRLAAAATPPNMTPDENGE